MKVQDGVQWVRHQYERIAAESRKKTGAYKSAVYRAEVPEELVLEFAQYGTERVLNPATGKVAGSKRVVKEERERLTVPAGTDVRIYRAPNRAAPGETVAVFFLNAKHQVAFKRETDLVHTRL